MKKISRVIINEESKHKIMWFYDEHGAFIGHIMTTYISQGFREFFKEETESWSDTWDTSNNSSKQRKNGEKDDS